jgi:hypothetical protein
LFAYSLGRSGLKIAKVVLGTMSYGSSDLQGWVLDENDGLLLLKYVYDVGINTWDTVCSPMLPPLLKTHHPPSLICELICD